MRAADIVERLRAGLRALEKRKVLPSAPPTPQAVPAYIPWPVPYFPKRPKKERKVPEGIEIKPVRPTRKPAREVTEPLVGLDVRYPLIPRLPGHGEPVYAWANIRWEPKMAEAIYHVIEPALSADDRQIMEKIKADLEERLDIDFTKLGVVAARELLRAEIAKAIKLLGLKLDEARQATIMYYIERDTIGFGRVEPLMADPNIEDISCDGVGIPLFVYHRDPKLASLRTDVMFESPEELNSFVVKLAQRCNKTLSIAEPLLDGTLADGSRVQATLGTDIARKGSNFTIRRFTEKPLTPAHMMRYKTLDSTQLAYLWLAVEHGQSILVSGGTATGKTSLLNVLSLFIRPTLKVVSIEDSVAGECEILLEKDGKFSKVAIGPFIDRLLEKNSIEYLGRQICLNTEGLKIHTMDSDGRIVLAQPTQFIRHKTTKQMYELLTKTGRKIRLTEDHNLWGLDSNGQFVPIKTDQLIPGSHIAVPRLLKCNAHITAINLLSLLNGTGLYANLPAAHFCQHIKNYPYKKRRWWLTSNVLPFNVFKQISSFLGTEVLQSVQIRSKASSRGIPLIFKLTPDILEFFGLWLAKGSYDKNSIITSSPEPECQAAIKRAAAQLGLNTRRHSDKILINSKVLKAAMQAMGFVGDAKSMPAWVWNLPDDRLAALLKGYFSGNGHVSGHEIQIKTSSHKLLKEIKSLLLRFGIIASEIKFCPKDRTYTIRIDDVENFYHHISFAQKYKQFAAHRILCRKAGHTPTDVIPLPTGFLKKLGITSSHYLGSHMGRQHLLAMAERSSSELADRAARLAHSDIFWDEIVDIRPVKYAGYVYDIAVPGMEAFICNDIVVHNTAELRLYHPHWIPHVARSPISVKGRIGEVTLFDLLKSSLRQRPDYIIVGEVRGEEAFVLFQQIATGHPGLATIHAATIPQLIDRLTTPPISLPPSLLENIDVVVFLALSRLKERYVRRADSILEVTGIEAGRPMTNKIFEWKPITDSYEIVGKSVVLKKIARRAGLTEDSIKQELMVRKAILEWMLGQEVFDYKEATRVIQTYYTTPERVLDMVGI